MQEEEVRVIQYINTTFKDASISEMNNALIIIQNKIAALKLKSKQLIKQHFTKFIDCNVVLQEIQRELKYKADTNKNLKHKFKSLKEFSQLIKKEEKEEKIENSEEIRKELMLKMNDFYGFVDYFTGINEKEKFLPEKNLFLDFLSKKIEQEKDLDELIDYLNLYFKVNDEQINESKMQNTILLCFKEHANEVSIVNLDFVDFFSKLENILFLFFKFLNPVLKNECIYFFIKKIEEAIIPIKFKKETSIFSNQCRCFDIKSSCICKENQIKEKEVDVKGILILYKIFNRKIHEFKDAIKPEINIDMERSLALKIESFAEIFLNKIFESLSFKEKSIIYRDIKDIFNFSEKLEINSQLFLQNYIFSAFSCDILKYEFVRKNIFYLEKGKEPSIFIKNLQQLLNPQKIIYCLKQLISEIKDSISEKVKENYCNENSLIFVNRIVIQAPISWAEILKGSQDLWIKNNIVKYFLKRVFNLEDVVVTEEEMEIINGTYFLYGYLLEK